MACMNPDGSLSPSGRTLLEALGPSGTAGPRTAAELAGAVGLPLFRVRSSLREAGAAGLVVEAEDGVRRTPAGDEALVRSG